MDPFSIAYRGAMLVAALAATGAVHALGLGNLTVSSHLGQSLNARIALLGGPADLDPNCFKIAPANGNAFPLPNGLSVKLDLSGTRASLLIQTSQAINEPALMFTVSAACPERVQRDYALLLDPPGFRKDIPVIATESATSPTDSSIGATTHQARETSRPGKASSSLASPAQHRKQTVSKRAPKRVANRPENDGPRLILTGSRRLFSPASAQLALNLDVGLLDMTRKAKIPLTADELTDDNTALMRKLAHLEETLANLQQRNAELQQARAKALQGGVPSQKSPPEQPSGSSNWPYFLLGLVALMGGTAFVMYRRRQESVSPYDESEIWRITAPSPSLSMPTSEVEEEKEAQETSSAKPAHTGLPDQHEFTPSDSLMSSGKNEGTEVKDSVADEVEVFVAHGHSDLAIHMLEDHVEKLPDESPVPWLLLLDLLKRDGAEMKYEDYRQKCKLHFNVAMPAYGEVEIHLGDHGLESYAHIMSELVRLWPTDQVNAYLDDLIYDRRGGSRMGFDPATYRDIVLLRTIRASYP